MTAQEQRDAEFRALWLSAKDKGYSGRTLADQLGMHWRSLWNRKATWETRNGEKLPPLCDTGPGKRVDVGAELPPVLPSVPPSAAITGALLRQAGLTSESTTSAKQKPAPAGRTHLVIPDTQVRDGIPLDHLAWIGQYIVDRKPDVVVHLGDHWDMPSLSMHDPVGSMPMEGARYENDIEAGNAAMEVIVAPLRKEGLTPELHFLCGNHENRIERAIYRDPRFAGIIGDHHLNAHRCGFQVHEFLKIVDIDGIWYSHYFYAPNSGRPWGGTVDNRLNKIGHSFTQGHEQGFRYTSRYLANGEEQHGLVVGSAYLHDESYKGRQGNHHFRGVIVKHEVRQGRYDLMRVSLDYLCRKYEGMPLADFMRKKYPHGGHSVAG